MERSFQRGRVDTFDTVIGVTVVLVGLIGQTHVSAIHFDDRTVEVSGRIFLDNLKSVDQSDNVFNFLNESSPTFFSGKKLIIVSNASSAGSFGSLNCLYVGGKSVERSSRSGDLGFERVGVRCRRNLVDSGLNVRDRSRYSGKFVNHCRKVSACGFAYVRFQVVVSIGIQSIIRGFRIVDVRFYSVANFGTGDLAVFSVSSGDLIFNRFDLGLLCRKIIFSSDKIRKFTLDEHDIAVCLNFVRSGSRSFDGSFAR